MKTQDRLETMFDDPDRIPIGQAVQNFFRIAHEVRETKKRKILTKNGRALVAISPLVEVAMVEAVRNTQALNCKVTE
ncbi:MAG: hypothetical protein VR64_07225 [Desulfatitalea sp. BRH_c12]|nr:MAG: hypothetical protein VR64_07225 [Desulfatitalea sp. BRH_c12]